MSGLGMRLLSGRSLRAVSIILSGLALCWPAFVNGGAFYFPDTSAYLRGADAVLGEIASVRTEWSDKLHLYEASPASGASSSTVQQGGQIRHGSQGVQQPRHPVLLGRSVYYGLAVLPLILLFGSIGGALLHGMVAALSVNLTLTGLGFRDRALSSWQYAVTLALCLTTTLPYYVSILMPDVLAGVAIACAPLLIVLWTRYSTLERACLAGIVAFSAISHSSHVLILIGICTVGLFFRLTTRSVSVIGLAMVLAGAGSGIASERVFAAAVASRLRETPIRPPFLTARLVAEGPGYRFLKERCPAVEFEACRYISRMPRDSDTFLWSENPADGVFSATSHATQRKIAEQDISFAIATVQEHPLPVIQSMYTAVLTQLSLTNLEIFNAHSQADRLMAEGLPERTADEIRASRYYSGTMPVGFIELTSVLVAIGSLAWLLTCIALILRRRPSRMRYMAVYASIVLCGVAANAAITGALSKPHDRYNSRVTWVLPLAALAIAISARQRRIRKEALRRMVIADHAAREHQ